MDKVFIIAEIGNLHNGSMALAKRFINEALLCGANAIKFQTHVFSDESLDSAPNPAYFTSESRKKYFERTAFTFSEWGKLKRFAERKCKIEFISSAFSFKALEILEKIGVKRHKIPSGEVTNIPLLEKFAKTKKPLILSSGMSSWKELDQAVYTLRAKGCKDLTILQCTSKYPCLPEKSGLNVLLEIKKRYKTKTGLSDHTLGISASILAVGVGAEVIEKHLTLSRKMYGSDAKHSFEPKEFKRFVSEIRDAERIINSKVNKDKLAKELKGMKIIFEKSIVASGFISKGSIIDFRMLSFKKPGDGIRADRYREILGKKVKVDIKPDTKLKKEMLE